MQSGGVHPTCDQPGCRVCLLKHLFVRECRCIFCKNRKRDGAMSSDAAAAPSSGAAAGDDVAAASRIFLTTPSRAKYGIVGTRESPPGESCALKVGVKRGPVTRRVVSEEGSLDHDEAEDGTPPKKQRQSTDDDEGGQGAASGGPQASSGGNAVPSSLTVSEIMDLFDFSDQQARV